MPSARSTVGEDLLAALALGRLTREDVHSASIPSVPARSSELFGTWGAATLPAGNASCSPAFGVARLSARRAYTPASWGSPPICEPVAD